MYCNLMLDDVIVFLNISYLTLTLSCLIETRRYRIVVVVLQIVTQFSIVGDY
jgi:hypothetical protein